MLGVQDSVMGEVTWQLLSYKCDSLCSEVFSKVLFVYRAHFLYTFWYYSSQDNFHTSLAKISIPKILELAGM